MHSSVAFVRSQSSGDSSLEEFDGFLIAKDDFTTTHFLSEISRVAVVSRVFRDIKFQNTAQRTSPIRRIDEDEEFRVIS
jgi:hypothetical protein